MPEVLIESYDSSVKQETVDKVRKIAERAVEEYVSQNAHVIRDLEAIMPEVSPEFIDLFIRVVSGGVVFGATQALGLNVIFDIVEHEDDTTDEQHALDLAERMFQLKQMAQRLQHNMPPFDASA